MGINIMVSGEITVEMDGEYMKISRLDTDMLEIGNRTRKMDLGNKLLLLTYIKVILPMIKSKDLVQCVKMVLDMI